MKRTSSNTSLSPDNSSDSQSALDDLSEIPATAETGGTMNSSRQDLTREMHSFSGVGAAFASGFPPESRENLENLFWRGREILEETKNYVRENPAEAAGLLAASGAVLWALLGTRPGRHLVELGSPKLSRWLMAGLNETLQVQPKVLQ